MSANVLSHCGQCRALVNLNWRVCLVCQGPLETAASPTASPWLKQWRHLAQVSGRIGGDDPRYDPMLTALADCEAAYRVQDEKGFAQAGERALRVAAFVPGSRVFWRDEQKGICGPATVLDVILSDGRLWIWLEWEGSGRWLNEILVTRIEPKKGLTSMEPQW